MQPAERQMQFVYTLRSHGVTNADVLKAMEQTSREAFLEGIFRERAFDDTPLPIACGQTISQPSVVGLMTQALDVTRRCKVLEVGTGSGSPREPSPCTTVMLWWPSESSSSRVRRASRRWRSTV